MGAAHDPKYWITLHINGKTVSGFLDTGATHTVWICTVLQAESQADGTLEAYGGKAIKMLRTTTAKFRVKDKEIECPFFMVKLGHCRLFVQTIITD